MTRSTASSTLSRRRVAALGLALPVVAVAGRLATTAAHEGHHDGASTPTSASPEASPAAANTGTAAAYMTIQNTGAHNETLLGAHTDAARTVELHSMTVDANGVMQMAPVPSGVEIPAGESLELAPQSYHFMLIDLAHDLLPNTTYDLVLHFERAGDVSVTVSVQMTEPADTQAVSGTGEDVSILAAWSRPAPRIDGTLTTEGAPGASPAASPEASHSSHG
ncbi:MAG: copper chaperone PCu(A)C [Thermomicrobiales bacterium]